MTTVWPTPEQLDAIQARADAATEGPWTVDSFHDVVRPGMPADYIDTAGIIQDAEFIAHARTDIPALLALVRELEAKIERVQSLAFSWDRDGRPDMHAAALRAALTATEGA